MTSRDELIEEVAATIAVAELIRTHRTWGDLLEPQKDEYRSLARTVSEVFGKAQGEPGDDWREVLWDAFDEMHRITEGGCDTRGSEVADMVLGLGFRCSDQKPSEQWLNNLSYAATALEGSGDNGDRYCARLIREHLASGGFRRAEPTCEHGSPLSALCDYAVRYASGETDDAIRAEAKAEQREADAQITEKPAGSRLLDFRDRQRIIAARIRAGEGQGA